MFRQPLRELVDGARAFLTVGARKPESRTIVRSRLVDDALRFLCLDCNRGQSGIHVSTARGLLRHPQH